MQRSQPVKYFLETRADRHPLKQEAMAQEEVEVGLPTRISNFRLAKDIFQIYQAGGGSTGSDIHVCRD
jgi:hypothetical protein